MIKLGYTVKCFSFKLAVTAFLERKTLYLFTGEDVGSLLHLAKCSLSEWFALKINKQVNDNKFFLSFELVM